MSDWVVIFKLILSAALGGLLGYERERGKKAAGLRTHILVSMGSALVMLISIYVAEKAGGTADPGRIAAQVITGIGFLGAGTIIQAQGSVLGLTTAASLWVAAAIGLAVGCSFFWGAITAAALSFLVLRVLGALSKHIDSPD